ncbi:hypothetical protein J5U22_01431 [Saccharolobus shibatae]|uniref:Uncharacterized protein n=1 Tax=Saccharolobus shibatae TaxID=2286 RepID=A0A8F5C0I3_9CREN|nr:hypothetical protein J5U22_01431 [Saccharolobus shibatae]
MYKNTRGFYKWVFTCYMKLGLCIVYSIGNRDKNTFKEVKKLEKGK